jgi:uncharacterized membrane protein YcaP (DUF421 family)
MSLNLSDFPWVAVLQSMGKTALAYIFMLAGLRLIGKRVFRGIGPQELILITLLAKIVGDNIVSKEAGLISNIADGLTLFAMIYLVDCIPSLRHFVEGGQEVLYENSILNPEALARNMLSENDLQRVARDYGRKSYQDFERITLEKDGRLTGILKKEFRESQTHHMPLTQQKRF